MDILVRIPVKEMTKSCVGASGIDLQTRHASELARGGDVPRAPPQADPNHGLNRSYSGQKSY